MDTVNIPANSRDDFGKGAARKVRANGLLPAVIYRAGQPATSITMDGRELENAFRKTGNRNTLVDISVDGTSYVCLVKETQRDPLSRDLIHVDFFQVDESETVAVTVPVEPTGKAAGVTAGGKLRVIRRDLDVVCKPGDIPATVEVDVSNLEVGDFLRVSEVVAGKGVEIQARNDFNVVTVLGKRGLSDYKEGLEAAEGAEGAEEADGAEGSEDSE